MEALAGADAALGVSDLARMLDMPKARVHRHLSGLREHGYVVQTGRNNRYTTGWRLHLLGQQLVRKFDIMEIARPVMEELRDQVGQTVVISTFNENEVVVIDVVSGRSLLEIGLRPGTRFALNTVAQGKIALAFGPQDLRDRLFGAALTASTSHTITDPDRLRAEIDLTRNRGWADAPEEIFSGINAIAAPVLRNDRTLFGALALVGSIDFIPKTPDPRIIRLLQDSAEQISAGLGYRI
ncbi:IclR family transcriptional regulator [Rhodobacter sp. 24-YEA-8]|uniref:IclR family transcriptional regulator n=1 Tax=Rhodobacter sp. 24-YEA-8 TaxID=1884310 RepID=UPI0014957CF4|nr:IclR family transcriptional regulator [Rhodobacter sp. 24-YEA-8]